MTCLRIGVTAVRSWCRTPGALFAVVIMSCSVAGAAEPLRAGFAAADITPPVGYRRAGSYYEKVSTGIRDPLSAKAMVLRQGAEAYALVIVDLLSVPEPVSAQIRRQAAAALNIPASNIVTAATHNHGSPEWYGVLRDLKHEAAVAAHGRDPSEVIDYRALLVDACVTALADADAATVACVITQTTSELRGVAFNRRFHMRDGSVRFNPGIGNPDIVREAGPVDAELPFLLFQSRDDVATPLGALTTFAIHTATNAGSEFASDFPGVLQQRLELHFGRPFVSVFAEGTAGDINHIDVRGPKTPQPPGADAGRIGNAMADVIVNSLERSQQATEPSLRVVSRTVRVPFPPISARRYAAAVKTLTSDGAGQSFLDRVAAWRDTHGYRYSKRYGAAGKPLEVQVARVDSDTAVVTLPHEVFVETGITIKAASPFRNTIVISLANDVDFYLPTRRAFEEGSYEVTTCPLSPGCAETMSDTAIAVLNELKP